MEAEVTESRRSPGDAGELCAAPAGRSQEGSQKAFEEEEGGDSEAAEEGRGGLGEGGWGPSVASFLELLSWVLYQGEIGSRGVGQGVGVPWDSEGLGNPPSALSAAAPGPS